MKWFFLHSRLNPLDFRAMKNLTTKDIRKLNVFDKYKQQL